MSDFVLRPVAAADLVELCALHNRAEAHDGVARAMQLDELCEELDDDHVSFAADTRVAVRGGVTVGFAYVMFLPSDEGQQRAYVFGHVDPAARGTGIGRVLLAWSRDRATEVLQSADNGLPLYIRVEAYDTVTDARHLHARLGFVPVRYFEELLRPLATLPEMHVPDGVEIVAWPIGEGVERDEEIRLVKNNAFADHWGSTPTPPDRWHQMVHGVGVRPDLSHVAVDSASGGIIAACLNERYESDDALLGRRDGWIGSLSTLPAWRGRGIASALITRSLHTFADAGCTHASIAVDGDSPTGAARLYRSLGFEPQKRSVTSQIQVESAT